MILPLNIPPCTSVSFDLWFRRASSPGANNGYVYPLVLEGILAKGEVGSRRKMVGKQRAQEADVHAGDATETDE